MIWIDLEHKLPTDTDIPDWTPWTQQEWNEWLAESVRLRDQLVALETSGKREERNKLIDDNSGHWSKLKPWFETLSYGKCWFSETNNTFSHYDVEHFRPKKLAKNLDGANRDGYWWLAFDHMNCRLIGNVGNRKKGTWFPLASGSLIAKYGDANEESESKYLIDPIDQDDVSLITFDEEGKAVAVTTANDWERKRVEQTIKIVKLNAHGKLAERR